MADFEFALKSVDIDADKIIKKKGLESGGIVQQVIDSEVLRRMDPYIPLDTGELRDNGILNTEIGSGLIVYKSPYARKQYYIPMEHSEERTYYWFEKMKDDGGKEEILKAAWNAVGAK